ncbi:MAG: shikimate kinase [Gemmatimonadales bacterium]
MVLVGPSGSGKSSVGRLLARKLTSRLFDIDSIIERRTGQKISELFASIGEAEFRAMEREETLRALQEPPAVIVPGGGWAAQPNNLAGLKSRALTVYLETSPEVSAGRLEGDSTRPLLNDGDLLARLRGLLAEREPFYSRCQCRISTDFKSVAEVADAVVALALTRG